MILQRSGYILLILCMMAPLFGPFSELFSAILIAVLIAVGVYSGQYRRQLDPLKLLGIIFIGYFATLLLAGLFSEASLWQTLEALAPVSPVLLLGLAAFFGNPKWMKVDLKYLGSIATIAVLVMYIGALLIWQFQVNWQVLGKGLLHHSSVNGRLRLFAGNALPFGAIMVTLCGLCFVGWWQKSSAGKVISLAAVIIGAGIIALWTEARGPFLTFGLLLIPIMFGVWAYLRMASLSQHILLGVAIIAIATAVMLLPATERAFARLFDGLNTLKTGQSVDHSTYLRLVMYTAAWDAFSDNWLFGYGPHARFTAIAAHFPSDIKIVYSHAHNVFFNHAVAAGIFGLFAVFSILLAPVVLAWKFAQKRFGSELYFASILSLSMIGCGMSNVLLFHDLTAYFFATLSVIAAAALSYGGSEQPRR